MCMLFTLIAWCASARATLAVQVDDTPSIKVRTTNRRSITSASFAGKLVVVHFWSARSRPSVKSAPVLVDLHKQYASRGVYFLGLCMDPIYDKQANIISQQLGFTWFQSVDANAGGEPADRLAVQWRVQSVPESVLISPKGRVLWRGHPLELENQLAASIQTHPPRPVAMIDYEIALEKLQDADLLASGQKFTRAFAIIESISPHLQPDAAMKKLANRINTYLQPDTSEKARLLRMARTQYPDAIKRLEHLRSAKVAVVPAPNPNTHRPPQHHIVPSVSEATLISRLKLAERYIKAGNDIKAYDVYVWIVEKAGNTDIGRSSAKKVAAFEADPAFMARHKVITEQRKAEAQLAFADQLKDLKQIDAARRAYQKVIDLYPRTVAAARAQIQLDKLPEKPDEE